MKNVRQLFFFVGDRVYLTLNDLQGGSHKYSYAELERDYNLMMDSRQVVVEGDNYEVGIFELVYERLESTARLLMENGSVLESAIEAAIDSGRKSWFIEYRHFDAILEQAVEAFKHAAPLSLRKVTSEQASILENAYVQSYQAKNAC